MPSSATFKEEATYSTKWCPVCRKDTYFNSEGRCQCCHFVFSALELATGRELSKRLGPAEFLCDTCMFDWRSTCHNPARPCARVCVDYRRK